MYINVLVTLYFLWVQSYMFVYVEYSCTDTWTYVGLVPNDLKGISR